MFTDRDFPVSCDFSEDLWRSECPSTHCCVPRRCVIPKTYFENTDEIYYSFQPDRDVGIELVVPLAQHGEQRGSCLGRGCKNEQATGGGLE